MNYFSTVGRHHEQNQDYILFDKNRSYCAMVLADGVSTCSKSGKGAETVCHVVTEYLLQHGKRFFAMSTQEAVNCLLEYILFKLKQIAGQEKTNLGRIFQYYGMYSGGQIPKSDAVFQYWG